MFASCQQATSHPFRADWQSAYSRLRGGSPMKLPHRRQFLHLAAGAAALPAVSRVARAGANLSGTAGAVGSRFSCWRRSRHNCSPDRTMAARAARPAVHHREPAAFLATEAVVRAPGDGYTLLLVATPNAINATLYDKLSFNFIRDIAPVASTHRSPLVVVVNPSVPAKTVPEFIAYVRANRNRQDQHGFRWHRKPGACRRRAFQDDGRGGFGPRALSW